MSVFSLIRRGRQAAKEHSAKQVEKQKAESEKAPYRHVPTHAAIDALSGAPSSFKLEDRTRIIEANKRRSAMTASGVGMGYPGPGAMSPVHMGMPRTNSSLSQVAYPSVYASPVVQVPRTYSYSGVPQGWHHGGGEVVYTPGTQTPMSLKGKEVERPVLVDSGRASRASSKANSPAASSSGSTSSQDDLEMRPPKHPDNPPAGTPPEAAPPPPAEHHHRLHPTSRRRSEPPVVQGPLPQPWTPASTTPPRAPGAPRAFAFSTSAAPATAPYPSLPPLQFGSLSGTVTPVASSVATPSSFIAGPNLPALSPGPSVLGPATPASVAEEPQADYFSAAPVGTAITTPSLSHKGRRAPKTARFSEPRPLDPYVAGPAPEPVGLALDFPGQQPAPETPGFEPAGPYAEAPRLPALERLPTLARERTRAMRQTLPTEFDEASFSPAATPEPEAAAAAAAAAAPRKAGKLSKAAGAKPAKKNRWSIRSSKPAAAAA